MHRVGRAAVLMIMVMAARPRASDAQNDTTADTSAAHRSSVIIAGPLGIRAREDALGVAHQTVRGAELVDAREPNIVSALAGKVAGADVTNNSTTNGSVHIVLRGQRSLAGDDQPLFVVDGIPVDNSKPTRSSTGDAPDYGNTVEDIDPNDIASVTVLTGANAAALYGARAANGAILIATKTAQGTNGFGVSASQYFTFETPLRLPEFQNQYGQGSNGQYAYVDGLGNGTFDNVQKSWGPPLDGRPIVQWWSNGQPAPWLPQPNNVRDFFDRGQTATMTASVSAAGSLGDIRLSLSNMNQQGMLPTNTLKRVSTSLTGGTTIFGKLTTRVSLRYARDDGRDRPRTGVFTANAMNAFIFGGRQLDLTRLQSYATANGATTSPAGEISPYQDIAANPTSDARDHVIGVVSASYAVNPWLSATLRSGTDWYHDRWIQRYGPEDPFVMPDGFVLGSARHHRENNTDLLLSAARGLSPTVHVAVNVGAGRRQGSTNELDYTENPGPFSGGVFQTATMTMQRTRSVYAGIQFAYRSYLFVNATGRNDWTTPSSSGFTSNFYPSVSGAWVFTDALPRTRLNGLLSYGKVRASWAHVGGDAFDGPNRTLSSEAGLDLGFAHDRVMISGTYYDARALDHVVVGTDLGNSLGVRIGDIALASRGIEGQLTASPIRRANFRWDVSVNVAKNRTRVSSMPGGVNILEVGSGGNVTIQARLGQPYGLLVGTTLLRDSAGQLIVMNGLPVSAPQKSFGQYAPDWIGGLENQFHYRQFDLSVLVDTKQGGKIFSGTEMIGDVNGVLASSLRGRKHGESLDGGGGLIVPGVNPDGTPNTTRVTAQSYFEALSGIDEPFVYDASFIKLREVRLGYTVPPRVSARLRLASIRIAAIGRNLWLNTKVPDIDPEATFANGDGHVMEFLSVPSARSYGLALNVTP